jgi:hypothetical protein
VLKIVFALSPLFNFVCDKRLFDKGDFLDLIQRSAKIPRAFPKNLPGKMMPLPRGRRAKLRELSEKA